MQSILITVGNFGKLALKVADVRLETVTLPHLDGEEVIVVLLGLPTRSVLSEESVTSLMLRRECGDRK